MLRGAALSAVAMSLAACGFFSSGGPSSPAASSPGSAAPQATPTWAPTPTPSPTPQLVHSLTLVASIGEPAAATPAGLVWSGVQDAAANLGTTPTLVQPATAAGLAPAIEAASAGSGALVVTVGAAAADVVEAAAAAHPSTQYLEVGVAVPEGSPANVHGIVFDQAQSGYLAGFVAASFSSTGKVAFVGVTASDVATSNYAAGFAAGVREAAAAGPPGTAAASTVAYAGTDSAPEKGRATSAALIKAGNDVLTALPDLSGFGAMRDACGRKARLVALGSDAWQTLPDVQSCLIVSVLDRGDVAARDAILAIAHGSSPAALLVANVANGGIALSDFHVELPAGFSGRLAGVLAAVTAGGSAPAASASAS
jgi:basic membrane protein A